MVTFTRVAKSYDPATDTSIDTTITVSGSAMQVGPDYRRYKALNLVVETMPTLLFCPTYYGACPVVGDTTTWATKKYTVRDVAQIAPDGVVIAARIVLGG